MKFTIPPIYQTFKQAMEKLSGPLETRVFQFLFRYRSTPHTTTEMSPAEALFNRPFRTRLDLVFPDRGRKVQSNSSSTCSKKFRSFLPNDLVYFRNFRSSTPKWIPGVIEQYYPLLSYVP